uniref:Protein HEXIM1 n=1 Tax=Naja naja TaxID=35670 RepID=A0A8C7E2D4_NAJNA
MAKYLFLPAEVQVVVMVVVVVAFLGTPPTNQELLQEKEMANRWQPREATKQQDGNLVSDVAFPGIDFTVPVVGESQSLCSPEEGINQIEDQIFGAEKQLGKKKHRRRPSKKKKHWQPYYKLTWEEKKKFEEKQSQRASRVRAEMFAKGQPVAPYNTTQFLMEDHDQEEPDLKTNLYPKRSVIKSDEMSEEDFVEEEEDGREGLGGDESLQNMSKQESIKEYLELEKCLSRMEDENNCLQMENKKFAGDPWVSQLEQERDRLRAENQKLLEEKEAVGPRYRQEALP